MEIAELKCIYRSDRFTSVSSTTDYYYDEGDDDVFGNKRVALFKLDGLDGRTF